MSEEENLESTDQPVEESDQPEVNSNDEEDNLVKYVLRLNCPIGDYLRDNAPDTEYSSNYCDLDEYIAKEYNPNIRYSRRHWAPGGDQYSELIWELDTKDIIE